MNLEYIKLLIKSIPNQFLELVIAVGATIEVCAWLAVNDHNQPLKQIYGVGKIFWDVMGAFYAVLLVWIGSKILVKSFRKDPTESLS